mgnify:CR=1 FL=1
MAIKYIGKYVGDTPAKRKFQRKAKDDAGNNTIQVGTKDTDGFILQTTSSSNGNDLAIKAGDCGIGKTNGAGGDLLLFAGRGTGSGASGEISFRLFPAGGSGTSYNSAVEKAVLNELGNLQIDGRLTESSRTRIKILHSDFIADDGGRPLAIDDTGVASEELFLETVSTNPAYVTVDIPTGYKATAVMIFGSGTTAVEVWEHQINSKTGVSKGTGNVDTEINITDVTSSTTNYLFIQVAQGSGDEIHGGYVTIAAV